MADEFEGDLSGAVFWGADLSRARFRDVVLTGVTISHSTLVDVEIDASIAGLVVNGVDVTDFVNRHDPWYPLRSMLRPADPADMPAAWDALEREWARTIDLARSLPDDALYRSVNGEWSFVDTVRHVVFALDKWCSKPLAGRGFHPVGLPNTGSVTFAWPGLDPAATPSVDEALAVRGQRAGWVRGVLTTMVGADLSRPVDILENGPRPLAECVYAVLEESFWHNRYARRDLAQLGARA